MKTTKYNSLKEMVEAPYSVSGIRSNSQEKWMLSEILRKGFVHTGYYQGSGRHAKAVDMTFTISAILEGKGIAHETGNDAPRGGICGNYVKVTSPSFMKEVKKVMAEEAAQRDAERKALLEKQEAHRQHSEWVKAEAAKIDLEKYREDITKIYTEVLGYKLPKNDKNEFANHMSRKTRGKVAWNLTHMYKGFNIEVLCEALTRYSLVKF